MMRMLRLLTFLALVGVFMPASAWAGEKSLQPVAAGKPSATPGSRQPFINKTAIAERARARRKALPRQPKPNAGRGFLLEKAQGGHGSGRLTMEKLRQRQLAGYRRRAAVTAPVVDRAVKHTPLAGSVEMNREPASGYPVIACACAILASAVFVVFLRRRRGQKKKARRL